MNFKVKYFCKFLLSVCLLFLINSNAYCIQDINNDDTSLDTIELQVEKNDLTQKLNETDKKKSYRRKKIGQPDGTLLDLFRSSGYTFESGPIKNQKFRYFYHGGNLFSAKRGTPLSNNTQFIANEFQTITLFADNKTTLMAAFNFSRETDYDNNFFEKFSLLYLDHKFNENQNLYLGEMRVPVGVEGGISSSALKLVSRSQIARTHGNYISNGIKNTGNYKYGYYNAGFYDGSRYFNHNFDGYEFAVLGGIKPLEKFDGKYGSLKIGGSIDVGDSVNSFSVVGGHASYNYKKIYADFEYLYADGCSGIYYGQGRSHGLYTTIAYMLRDNLELVGRYDFFQNFKNDKVSQEYTVGLTYYLNPQTKLMLNYILGMNDQSPIPSHKIYIGADFLSSFLLDLF